MENVKNTIKSLAEKHLLLGHREYEPHFAYMNDEKDMLLPAQMGYPFLLFGHGGFQNISDDQRRWQVILSVQTHVSDTGDMAERNRALNLCHTILDDIVARITSMELKLTESWTRGIDLEGATGTPIENVDDALYGWMLEFSIILPWCKVVNDDHWQDLKILNDV